MPRDMLQFSRSRFVIAQLIPSAVAALLLGSGIARAGDAQVYKTVDEHGNVVYSDRPSSTSAQKSTVHFHEPSADDLARLDQRRKATQAAENERLQQAAASNIARAQQERVQKEKQVRCENARTYYNSLRNATRVYQLDAEGNRVYLPDAEVDAKRTEARDAMEAACAS